MKVTFKNFEDRSLCDKCEHGVIIKTATGKRTVRCEAMMKFVSPNIVECTYFQAKGTLSKWDMEKVAWTLETKNGKMGFERPVSKKDPRDYE